MRFWLKRCQFRKYESHEQPCRNVWQVTLLSVFADFAALMTAFGTVPGRTCLRKNWPGARGSSEIDGPRSNRPAPLPCYIAWHGWLHAFVPGEAIETWIFPDFHTCKNRRKTEENQWVNYLISCRNIAPYHDRSYIFFLTVIGIYKEKQVFKW